MAIRPTTLQSQVTIVSIHDPGIDRDTSKIIEGGSALEYARDRDRKPGSWRDTVGVKAGDQLTEFIIGAIPPAELARIEDEARIGTAQVRPQQMMWECFLAGLRDIRHGPTKDGKVPMVQRAGVDRPDPVWLGEVFARGNRMIAMDIGQACYTWNQLTDGEIKNS